MGTANRSRIRPAMEAAMTPRTRHVSVLSCASVALCTAFLFEPALRPDLVAAPTAPAAAGPAPQMPQHAPAHANWQSVFWTQAR